MLIFSTLLYSYDNEDEYYQDNQNQEFHSPTKRGGMNQGPGGRGAQNQGFHGRGRARGGMQEGIVSLFTQANFL